MTLTPEIVAKLIFAVSELRYFEKEVVMEPNQELQDICIKCQYRVDSILIEMGMEGFIPLNDLINVVKIEFNGEQKVLPIERD